MLHAFDCITARHFLSPFNFRLEMSNTETGTRRFAQILSTLISKCIFCDSVFIMCLDLCFCKANKNVLLPKDSIINEV